MTLDELKDTFAFLDSWEDKYRLVIDLGKDLPALPDSERQERNLVRGCQSQVWLVTRYDPVTDRLYLGLDSDAHIVRGLIAIVLAAYDGHSPRDILDFDIEALFKELDLVSHLSPTRGNGLRAMVARIRQAAATAET
ncbi:MAG: SufE family protein [Pseudomonadales bacterium]|jgi:cysteine desulfuration protein SufE